jgi:hypothetical protein
MSVQTGSAANVGALLDALNAFLTLGHALDPQYTGTGTGTIGALIGTSASVIETITATATDATHFAVVGSVSGALGTATVGVAFTSAVVNFTITAGGVAFIAGDVISLSMTPPWSALESVAGSEYIWSAPGNDGTANILVGASRFSSVGGDYDDLRLGGSYGYSSALTFVNQPGAMTDTVLPLLRVGALPYWFVANGRRAVVVVKASTNYELAYLGFLNAYTSPSIFPYPLVVGGSMNWSASGVPPVGDVRWRWSYNGNEHIGFPFGSQGGGDLGGQLKLRRPDGLWRGFAASIGGAGSGGGVWPYGQGSLGVRENLDGSYSLVPILLTEDSPNAFGELDGVAFCTGYNQVSENTVTINRVPWLVVQNIFRTTAHDYCAVKLA